MAIELTSPVRSIVLLEAEMENGREVDMFKYEALPSRVRQILEKYSEEHGGSASDMKKGYENGFAKQYTREKMAGIDKFTMMSKDVIDAQIKHALELYDKEQDERILQSENIVEVYNQMIHAHFKKAYEVVGKLTREMSHRGVLSTAEEEQSAKYTEEAKSSGTVPLVGMISTLVDFVENYNESFAGDEEAPKGAKINDAEVEKMLIECAYTPSDNPKEIRQIVQARINYNNAMIQIFQRMLNQNYKVLGITADEASMLSMKLQSSDPGTRKQSIKEVKEIVEKNKAKFQLSKPRVGYDLRSIGGGCMFVTEEETGLDFVYELDHIIQMLMTHDCIVLGHGGTSNDKIVAWERTIGPYFEQIDERLEELSNKMQEYNDKEYQLPKKRIRKELKDKYNIDDDKLDKILNRLDDEEEALDRQLSLLRINADEIRDQLSKVYDSFKDKYDKYKDGTISSDEFDEYSKQYDEVVKPLKAKLDKIEPEIDKLYESLKDIRVKNQNISNEYYEKYFGRDIEEKSPAAEYLRKRAHECNVLYSDLIDSKNALVKKYNKVVEEETKKGNTKWVIQPVSTLKGGPFTDVNELVRQLIKEGFKDIVLMSCNPGHHQLAKDIQNAKGVKITFAKNTLMAENVNTLNPEDDYYELDKSIIECENSLKAICEYAGFSYYDDNYLNECVSTLNDSYLEAINEGVLKNAWTKLVEFIKKAFGFIVGLFKKIIEFVKKIIQKIKDFFGKIFGSKQYSSELNEPVKTSTIMLEASVRKYSAKSWGDIQKVVISSCEKIQRAINDQQNKQTKNLQELQRYAEGQAKSVNESSNPQLDSLLSLIL